MDHPQPWAFDESDKQQRIFDADGQPVAICRSRAVARFIVDAIRRARDEDRIESTDSRYQDSGD